MRHEYVSNTYTFDDHVVEIVYKPSNKFQLVYKYKTDYLGSNFNINSTELPTIETEKTEYLQNKLNTFICSIK